MARIKCTRAPSSVTPTIEDGQIFFQTDTRKMLLDVGSDRIPLSEILVVPSFPVVPLSDKLYLTPTAARVYHGQDTYEWSLPGAPGLALASTVPTDTTAGEFGQLLYVDDSEAPFQYTIWLCYGSHVWNNTRYYHWVQLMPSTGGRMDSLIVGSLNPEHSDDIAYDTYHPGVELTAQGNMFISSGLDFMLQEIPSDATDPQVEPGYYWHIPQYNTEYYPSMYSANGTGDIVLYITFTSAVSISVVNGVWQKTIVPAAGDVYQLIITYVNGMYYVYPLKIYSPAVTANAQTVNGTVGVGFMYERLTATVSENADAWITFKAVTALPTGVTLTADGELGGAPTTSGTTTTTVRASSGFKYVDFITTFVIAAPSPTQIVITKTGNATTSTDYVNIFESIYAHTPLDTVTLNQTVNTILLDPGSYYISIVSGGSGSVQVTVTGDREFYIQNGETKYFTADFSLPATGTLGVFASGSENRASITLEHSGTGEEVTQALTVGSTTNITLATGTWTWTGSGTAAPSPSSGTVTISENQTTSLTLSYPCFLEGTPIWMADGTSKKIEDITYDDELLVWDFDNGCLTKAKPVWIMPAKEGTYWYHNVYSDGRVLDTTGPVDKAHREFCLETGSFEYTNDVAASRGTTYTNERPIKHIISQRVDSPCRFYNIITEKHFNLFANGILTSCRLSNMYPIKDMKYVKDDRKPAADYHDVDPEFRAALRLDEQPTDMNYYVDHLKSMMVPKEG